MSGWTDGQCSEFARRFARSPEGRAWFFFVDDVRDALIDQFVMNIVLAQEKGEIQVADIRSLRARLAARLATKHHLSSPHYEIEREQEQGS